MEGEQGLAYGEGVQGPHHHRHGEQGKHQRFPATKRKVKLDLGAGHDSVDTRVRRGDGIRQCGWGAHVGEDARARVCAWVRMGVGVCTARSWVRIWPQSGGAV
jgi:hypothetical protein